MIHARATQVGDPVIRAKAKRVTAPMAPATQAIVDDLIDSMRHHDLVGMAAPQIGEGQRIFVTELRETKLRRLQGSHQPDPVRVFINPAILASSNAPRKGWEGCGSVAHAALFGMVSRPASVTVEATDRHGKPFRLKASGLLARVIQHELDHLNGIVFLDRADTKTLMGRDEYLAMRSRKR